VTWLYATPLLTALVSFNPAGLASGALPAAAVAGLASMLVTVQCGAMIVQLVSQLAEGRDPDVRAAWRATTTVVPRLMLPCLVLSVTTCLISAAGLTVVLNTLRTIGLAARADRTSAVSAILALMGGLALVGLAAVAATWVLRVRLFLLLPAASLERLPGFAPVQRSWRLTRGIAGLVFGALVVVALVDGAVIGFGGQFASALVAPSLAAGGFGGLVTLMSQLMPAIAVMTAIGATVATFTWPFLTVMSTLVHRTVTGYRLTPLMSG
jgi:hypothetical protein